MLTIYLCGSFAILVLKMWYLLLIAIVLGIVLIALSLNLYIKSTTGWDNSFTCLVGKTTLITGSNTGIGYETAKEFAKRGARVILACRNKEKAEEAQRNIIKESDNTNVIVKIVDFSSLNSIRALADDINVTEERLDILVNNAGATNLGKDLTEDGLNSTMQVNYFGSFLLTILLIDLIKKSSPSRIVNVSSIMAKIARIDPDDLNKPAVSFQLYARSKLCNILFTKELAKKLEYTGVTTFSLHPGVVSTNIMKKFVTWHSCYNVPLALAQHLFFKTPREGAQTQIHLSLVKGIEQFNGEHFHDCRKVSGYWTSKVSGLAEALWKKSEEIVQLSPEEKLV